MASGGIDSRLRTWAGRSQWRRHRRLHPPPLQIAGRSDTLFSAEAIRLIHNASGGHPRAVNNLASHALTAAFAADHANVDEKAARIAISETAAD